jgi:hypothetical protein
MPSSPKDSLDWRVNNERFDRTLQLPRRILVLPVDDAQNEEKTA